MKGKTFCDTLKELSGSLVQIWETKVAELTFQYQPYFFCDSTAVHMAEVLTAECSWVKNIAVFTKNTEYEFHESNTRFIRLLSKVKALTHLHKRVKNSDIFDHVGLCSYSWIFILHWSISGGQLYFPIPIIIKMCAYLNMVKYCFRYIMVSYISQFNQ